MHTDTFLQRFVRKALTKRQHRNADGTPKDFGVGVTGVVVTIVILGILAAVGGPPLFSLIFDAREFKLENNVQEAAQVLQQRLTLEPDLMDAGVKPVSTPAVPGDAMPTASLLVSLVEDAPYKWKNDLWAYQTGDDDETIRVQFLNETTIAAINAAGHVAAGTADTDNPPGIDWVGANSRAVRLHSRNSDGRWACALIVVQAEADGVEVAKATRYNDAAVPPNSGLSASATVGSELARTNSRLMNAWLSGIWYDSGDVVTTGEGEHDCSPVDNGTAPPGTASFPSSADQWKIDDAGTGTTDPVRTFTRAL